MITSAVFRGLIHAGRTPLASTIRVEQTAPLELTVRAGIFTATDGMTFTLENDRVLVLAPERTSPRQYEAELGINATGDVDVWLRMREGGGAFPMPPLTGWRTLTILVCLVTVPPGTADLAPITINVLDVRPGFPPGVEPPVPGQPRFEMGTA